MTVTMHEGTPLLVLKYLFSSQSAVMWMSALFVMATVAYFAGLFANNNFTLKTASVLTWSALVMGLTGMMARWNESYLRRPRIWAYSG